LDFRRFNLKFGLQHPNFSYDGDGPAIVDSLKRLTTTAESLGFDSFWVMDHFHQIGNVGQPQESMLEGWTTQAVVASFTSTIKLGTLVTGNLYRHPSLLAKIGATLDVLSKGRLFMGIGAAWNEEEAAAYGIPFPMKERFRRLEEAVQIIQKMWSEDPASFDGRFYRIHNAYCNPKPIQKPHPPIMIGGSGEHETLKLVAKYADACNIFGSVETVKRKLQVLQDHCKTVGRDYNSILKTRLGRVMIEKDADRLQERVAKVMKNVPAERFQEFLTFGTPDQVRRQIEAFRDAGIEYFIVNLEPDRELEALDLFSKEITNKL
jgi:F420-dependent oxidoreductase-like protein